MVAPASTARGHLRNGYASLMDHSYAIESDMSPQSIAESGALTPAGSEPFHLTPQPYPKQRRDSSLQRDGAGKETDATPSKKQARILTCISQPMLTSPQKTAHFPDPTAPLAQFSTTTASKIALIQHVDGLLAHIKDLEVAVEQKDLENAALRREKDASENEMLAHSLELLNGEAEQTGVSDFAGKSTCSSSSRRAELAPCVGVITALREFHTRLRNEASAAKTNKDKFHRDAINAYHKFMVSDESMRQWKLKAQAMEKRVQDSDKVDQEIVERIVASKSPSKGR